MGTVLVLERHPVQPGSKEAYEAWLGELLDATRAQPGVLWTDAAEAFDDAPSFLVLSEWLTEGDLEAWESSEGYGTLTERADPWLRESPMRRRFTDAG